MATEPTNVGKHTENIPQGIHVVAKPIGPVCNLNYEFGPGLRGDTRLVYESEELDPAGCHVVPWDDFNAGRQTLPLSCRCDQPSPAEPEILHALPRTQKKNGGKRSEEGVKTIVTQSIDIFHTLQFCRKGSKLQGMV